MTRGTGNQLVPRLLLLCLLRGPEMGCAGWATSASQLSTFRDAAEGYASMMVNSKPALNYNATPGIAFESNTIYSYIIFPLLLEDLY